MRDFFGKFVKGYYQGFGFKKGNHPQTEFKKGRISCNKGRNYEEIYDVEKAKRIKAEISKKNKVKKPKISTALKGKRNSPKTEFKKGQVSRFMGKHHSEETIKKMSISHKGKFVGKKHSMWGKHHSVEAKKKISEKVRGRKISEKRKIELAVLMKGENNPSKRPDVKQKISSKIKERYTSGKQIPPSGELHYNWKGGYQPYYGPNWKRQRRIALKNARGICQKCGAVKSHDNRACHVHHKIPFREFGLNRYAEANALDNLVVLCTRCHRGAE